MKVCPTTQQFESCLSCTVRKVGWFCHFSPQVLGDYDRIGTSLAVPAGRVLFNEGQSPRSVFAVCEGQVKLTTASRSGRDTLVQIAKPGDLLGLSAALSNSPHEVRAEAIMPTQIKTFHHRDFIPFIQRHGESSLHAAENLNEKYRSALNSVSRLSTSSKINGKVAHLLFELAAENGTQESIEPEFHLSLRHQDLASMLGSTRETVNRVLNHLRRSNVISIKGTRVTIRKKRALELLL